MVAEEEKFRLAVLLRRPKELHIFTLKRWTVQTRALPSHCRQMSNATALLAALRAPWRPWG